VDGSGELQRISFADMPPWIRANDTPRGNCRLRHPIILGESTLEAITERLAFIRPAERHLRKKDEICVARLLPPVRI
jgi:hypothetical protein